MDALEKEQKLRGLLSGYQSVAVAFSGGVDSTYLLHVAGDVLGDKVIGITAISETYPQRERNRARQLAREMGVRIIEIETHEIEDSQFRRNPSNRCYYCKWELFSKIRKIAESEGIKVVVDGSNLDDLKDHRPGLLALNELQVESPLRQCEFTKAEIRHRSRELRLKTWDLPAFACLASRIPYGTAITSEALKQVERAEDLLYSAGLRTVRVRHHGDVARIEVEPAEIARFADEAFRSRIVAEIKETGYKYVALDLQGYRTGSMNETLAS
ncbi:MAG: ATP-dependent sacrificial sulfur transferase LarE [bacterium]|nr:ATP-dependent sacrificial sulfur transferase LarE [bacterium]